MSRAPRKPKTAVQQAIVDLRRRLGMTQLELAVALEVTPVTIARWETTYPPRENGLSKLAQFADHRGDLIYASIFNGALRQAEEIRYGRETRMADESLDFEAAISNVYRAVTAHPDPRLLARWIEVLDALMSAHRLVVRRAAQSSLVTEQEVNQRIKFKAEDLSDLVQESIEELANLHHRLNRYRDSIAAQNEVAALRYLDRRLAWSRDKVKEEIAPKTKQPSKQKGKQA
jgi:transcriptional regulator with XRE-family HTH domain